MAKINKKLPSIHTHEGGVAKRINPLLQLRRSVMACLLWENTFYESGVEIAERIRELVHQNKPEDVAKIAIIAREKMKLRHVPLLLVSELCNHKDKERIKISDTIARVIQRADELTELLAIYWKNGKKPLANQLKDGLAKAFPKFSAYDLAKYNREEAIKLRDVLFICHPKPKNAEQAEVWKSLANKTLPPPDTWEVALSTGKDKKETWERLIKENKLGALALLRNLRNMESVFVQPTLIKSALKNLKVERVLPFRFITSARYAPAYEPELEDAMLKGLSSQEKLSGKTVLLIDVSGSMDMTLSAKGDTTRIDVACGIGILLREICEDVSIYTFSEKCVLVPARHGFALRDSILNSQHHSSTYLGRALGAISKHYDRIIVITDEQSHDNIPNPSNKGYVINVGSNQNGVGYGAWLHIDGFSESVIDYIRTFEQSEF
jgi:hypothetical protein